MPLIYQLLAAFGGGMFGALIGGTNAFIFLGIMGFAGVMLSLATGNNIILTTIGAGPFIASHVGFAGGVAGLAVINRKKAKLLREGKLSEENRVAYEPIHGTSVFVPLYSFFDSSAILAAGVFAACGHLLNYFFSTALPFKIDTIALTIVFSNVLVRLLIGGGGIVSKKVNYQAVNKHMLFHILWALPFSIVIAYITIATGNELLGFYFSAFSLILASMGKRIPVTHHISLVTGFAAIKFHNIFVAAAFGLCAMIIGEYFNAAVNDEPSSLIDMPSTIIALLSFVILTIL